MVENQAVGMLSLANVENQVVGMLSPANVENQVVGMLSPASVENQVVGMLNAANITVSQVDLNLITVGVTWFLVSHQKHTVYQSLCCLYF